MPSAFNGISFTADGGNFEESREGRVAIQEIPGGDFFYVDRGGRSPQHIRMDVVLEDASAWGALNAAIGDEGTLTIDSLDTHSAVLMRVSRSAPFADNQVKASVEFLITDI